MAELTAFEQAHPAAAVEAEVLGASVETVTEPVPAEPAPVEGAPV